jgi:hypothetical protein
VFQCLATLIFSTYTARVLRTSSIKDGSVSRYPKLHVRLENQNTFCAYTSEAPTSNFSNPFSYLSSLLSYVSLRHLKRSSVNRLRPLHFKLLSAHHSRPLFQTFLQHNNFSLTAPREIKQEMSNTNELSCLVLKVMEINEMRNRGKCIKKKLKFALKS